MGHSKKLKSHWRVVYFYKSAQKEIAKWPSDIKKELGGVLTRLQKGESIGMPDVRSMPTVGKGAAEIRIGDDSGIYRLFFIVWKSSSILVFHGFKKTSQATPQSEIESGKIRLKNFLEELEK
jgi:phage-related protein